MASAVQSCITPLSSRAKPGHRQSWQAFRYRTSVAMNNLPLAILAPVDLRCSEGIDAGLAVDDCLGVLVSHGVGDVASDLCCDDLESERRAAGERARHPCEELINLRTSCSTLQSSQDGHGLFSRPDLTTGAGISLVNSDFGVSKARVHPSQKPIAITQSGIPRAEENHV